MISLFLILFLILYSIFLEEFRFYHRTEGVINGEMRFARALSTSG